MKAQGTASLDCYIFFSNSSYMQRQIWDKISWKNMDGIWRNNLKIGRIIKNKIVLYYLFFGTYSS